MIKAADVFDRIKDTIDKGDDVKIFYADVARVLGIDPFRISKMKKRDQIPYQQILEFCIKHNYSASYIFLGLGHQKINNDNPKKYLVTIKEM